MKALQNPETVSRVLGLRISEGLNSKAWEGCPVWALVEGQQAESVCQCMRTNDEIRKDTGARPYRGASGAALHRLEMPVPPMAKFARWAPKSTPIPVSSQKDLTNFSLRPGEAINSANTGAEATSVPRLKAASKAF
jgi:hypothetical protein